MLPSATVWDSEGWKSEHRFVLRVESNLMVFWFLYCDFENLDWKK